MSNESDIIRYDDPKKMPMQWRMSDKGREAIVIASSMSSMKSGMYTSIPIICRGSDCPFIETCDIKAAGVDVDGIINERCPVEIADVVQRFQWYSDHLQVDTNNVIDLGMIKELVDIDVMLERASRRMASEGDFIEMVAVGQDADGRAIFRPDIRKSVDFKERMQKRKDTLLQLLNSTRKDKAGNKLQIQMDPSSYAAALMAKKKEIEAATMTSNNIVGVIDIEPCESDE